MKCCVECFNYDHIKNIIEEADELGKCDFCESEDVYVIDSYELYDQITILTDLYESVEDVLFTMHLREYEGDMLWEVLSNDWNLFNFYDSQMQQALLTDILSTNSYKAGGPPQILNNYVLPRNHYRPDDPASDVMFNMWELFERKIKNYNRFFLDKYLDLELLKEILDFRAVAIKKQTVFYRVRINTGTKLFSSEEMMNPPNHLASAGRANPKGISYFYLAEDDYTAVHETRPFLNDKVNSAEFVLNEDLTIIDLSNISIENPFEHGEHLPRRLEYLRFLRYLGNLLSQPINPKNADIEYLPTQYLCEYIKSLGYYGIKYKSQFGSACNFVFFYNEHFGCREVVEYGITELKNAELTFDEFPSLTKKPHY